MYVIVKGIKEDRSFFMAVVEGKSVEDVRTELVECMGIVANSQLVFECELLDIGFDVITKLGDINADTLPVVEIPINLNDNSDIF